MRTARLRWGAIGLAFALGIGAVTFSRAQQPGEKRVAAPTAIGDLRERVLKVRAEIDVVQVEYDVGGARWAECVKELGASDQEETKEPANIHEAIDRFRDSTEKELQN